MQLTRRLNTKTVQRWIEDLEDTESEVIRACEELAQNPESDQAKLAFEEAKAIHDPETLQELREFRAALECYANWWRGQELISEADISKYIREQFQDDLPEGIFRNHIDWAGLTLEVLREEYVYTTLRGRTYYMRMD